MGRPCPICGGNTARAYGYACRRCDGPIAAGRLVRRPAICPPAEAERWVAGLGQCPQVTYSSAAAAWGVTWREAQRRVNALVAAGVLSGVARGVFVWTAGNPHQKRARHEP